MIIIKEINCPVSLETCIKAMLYNYRYKDRKDFYICSLFKIKTAFKTCIRSMTYMNKLSGGSKNIKSKLIDDSEKIFNKQIKMLHNANYCYKKK